MNGLNGLNGFNGGFNGLNGGMGYIPGLGGKDVFSPDSRISDCATSDGNRTGICVRSTVECTSRGGRPLGTCYSTPQYGSNQGYLELIFLI